jgi:hypothetical protein
MQQILRHEPDNNNDQAEPEYREDHAAYIGSWIKVLKRQTGHLHTGIPPSALPHKGVEAA